MKASWIAAATLAGAAACAGIEALREPAHPPEQFAAKELKHIEARCHKWDQNLSSPKGEYDGHSGARIAGCKSISMAYHSVSDINRTEGRRTLGNLQSTSHSSETSYYAQLYLEQSLR